MLKTIQLFSLAALASLGIQAQSTSIVIDEDFSDWDSSFPTYTDGVDNAGGIDLLDVQVANDEEYLYIKFTTENPIDLTDNAIPHDLWLYIDTDNDPSTGFPEQTGYGAELAIDFNNRFAWFNIPDPNVQITFKDIGLKPAPTVTSNTFEIAIARNAQPTGSPFLFPSDSIRILIKEQLDGDAMPNEGEVFSYAFYNGPVETYEPIDLAKEEDHFLRMVHYNLFLNSGWAGADKLSQIETVVKTLDADIYAFSESANTSENEAKLFMNAWLPLSNENGWYARKHGGLITCSKWPFLDAWYLNRQLATLIDLPDDYPKDLLFVNAHLSCCGNETGRQEQADEFASFMLDAKTEGGDISLPDSTPVVYGGDLNLVGLAQQLNTLLTGDIQDINTFGTGGMPDWNNTPLADARPLHADQAMTYTWRTIGNGSNHYPPGRLDFQLYSDAVFNLEKAFILETESMSAERLAQLGLDPLLTYEASDHLPVTGDYSFPSTDTADSINAIASVKDVAISIYPNPSGGTFTIQSQSEPTSVVLMDLLGNHIPIRSLGEQHYQVEHQVAGVYLLQLLMDGESHMRTVILSEPH